MANVFNTAEVIDMGIEKEKKRRDFYALVAKKFDDKDMKELFSRLRDWEEAHIKKFTEIRNSIEESETIESYSGELETYMKSLVDDKLYREVSGGAFGKSVKTPIQAIRYGMGFEKDAILFFVELLKYTTPVHTGKIVELVNEEKKHLIYLADLEKKFE